MSIKSKLPLEYDGINKISDVNGDVVMWTEDFDEDEIELIVTACNQHDTLKAKAELLDGFVDWLELVDGKPFKFGETTSELVRVVLTLLTKAKELKE